jgi:hypothetical protein
MHDVHFLAVYGFTTDVPGVSDLTLVGATAYRMLDGTSDGTASLSRLRYQSEARRYARRFNQEMLGQMGKAGSR